MDKKEVIEVLRKCGAILDGHFELRSGLHSDCYFQCANVLRYPVAAGRLCEALVMKMRAEMKSRLKVDSVIAPAMGGIIVGHEIARVLNVRSIFAEKQEGKLVLRRFEIGKKEKFIVAEDVITRGGRVQETIDIVKNNGGEIVAVAVLVDRSGGKAVFDYPTFNLLEMEPVTWAPEKCPLCQKGSKPVHPGS